MKTTTIISYATSALSALSIAASGHLAAVGAFALIVLGFLAWAVADSTRAGNLSIILRGPITTGGQSGSDQSEGAPCTFHSAAPDDRHERRPMTRHGPS